MKTLLFLGDSITDCYHNYDTDNLGEGYVRMIAETLGYGFGKVKVINKGVDGFTISRLTQLWKREKDSLSADMITILIGINDIGVIKNTGRDAEFALKEFKMNYELLIQQIKEQYDVPIVLMEPFIFPCPQEYILWENELKEMSGIIEFLAKKHGLTFIPLWDKLRYISEQLSYDEITIDGIHLTELGHRMIAETWLDVVQNV